MWGSALLGDEYDLSIHPADDLTKSVISNLSQHPNFIINKAPIEKTSSIFSNDNIKSYSFAPNGDGWLESTYGKDANSIIRMCRKMRRLDKNNRESIDSIIDDIRTIKSMEIEATIGNLSWSEGLEDVIKNIGLNDRNLKALRKFGETRSLSLQKACQLYLKSMTVLNILNDNIDWGMDEQKEWANALQVKKDARKMWSNTLHQIDSLTKTDKQTLNFISGELTKSGPLSSRELVRRGVGIISKSVTPTKVGMLLKMYGEEVDIYKSSSRGDFVKLDTHGLIIKDIWAYAAGFLDADGSIFITERGEPRATFIATGDRGRLQCEELHKAIGCGRLVLNQRIHKKSVRSQHRLIFSSKDDLRQLLKGILPHLKMKSLQAKAVLSFVDEKDKMRKNELYRVVTYNNWKDDKKKADSFLSKWDLDEDTIGRYAESL